MNPSDNGIINAVANELAGLHLRDGRSSYFDDNFIRGIMQGHGITVFSTLPYNPNRQDLQRLYYGEGTTYNGERNLYEQFGYPTTNQIVSKLDDTDNPSNPLVWMYFRTIGGTVINRYVNATWNAVPKITAPDNPDFETAVRFFLIGEGGEYTPDEKLKMWDYLKRADRLMQQGRYCALVLGFSDAKKGEDLAKPVNGRLPLTLNWVTPFGDENIQQIRVSSFSERPNKPISYLINSDVFDTITDGDGDITGNKTNTVTVHWTRVVHFAENQSSNEVEGEPRLLGLVNRIIDYETSIGAGGNAAFLNTENRPAFTINDDATGGYAIKEEDESDINDMLLDYYHGRAKYLLISGVTPINQPGRNVDIRGISDPALQGIAAIAKMPLSILTGNQMSSVASKEDRDVWQTTVADRQQNWATDHLRDVIDRNVKYGILPSPGASGYTVGVEDSRGAFRWHPLFDQSPIDQADVNNRNASALKTAQDAAINGAPITEGEVRQYGGLIEDMEVERRSEALMSEDMLGG